MGSGSLFFFFFFLSLQSSLRMTLLHLLFPGPSLCIISVFFSFQTFNQQARFLSHSYRRHHAILVLILMPNLIVCPTPCPTFVQILFSHPFFFFLLQVFFCSWECSVRTSPSAPRLSRLSLSVAHARTTLPPPVFHALNALSVCLTPLMLCTPPPYPSFDTPHCTLRSCLGTTPLVLFLAPAFDRECNKPRRPSPPHVILHAMRLAERSNGARFVSTAHKTSTRCGRLFPLENTWKRYGRYYHRFIRSSAKRDDSDTHGELTNTGVIRIAEAE